MDILFSTRNFKWYGIEIPVQAPDAGISYLDSLFQQIRNLQNAFANVITPMSI
jgi:hypothetical protein